MRNETKAIVYYNNLPAGELYKNSTGYLFQYQQDYLHNPNCPSISISFPKRKEPFLSKILFPFFCGLLSEGENKEIFCQVLKIDPHDYFSLLLNTADTETIGAVTVRRQ